MSSSFNPMDCSLAGSSVWDSPGKYTGVGCHVLLQGIVPTQGIKVMSNMSPALAGSFFITRTTWEALYPLNNNNCANY